MKVLNGLRRLNRYLAFGIIGLLSLSILTAFAGIIIVSGNCTGTTNISNTNYVFTGSCTGTISTSETTTTTTTTMNPEVIYHVNGGPSCPTLGIAADVNSFRSDFTATNANGQDMWQINYYLSDLADRLLAVISFTSINGTHTASQLVYQNNVLIDNETVPVPITGDISKGQDIDFYTDGDGGQIFWYAAGQTSILFGHNFRNFLQGPGVPFVSFNDMAMQIAPIKMTGMITFTNLNLNIQMGQQFEQPQPPANIPVFPIITPDLCSLQQPVSPNINANQAIIGPKNNQTLIELEMKSS